MPTCIARALAVLTALAAAIVLSSCGGSSSKNAPASSQASQQASHNRADVVFAANMIPHHQQGLDMSAPVPSQTGNADLIKLASRIASAQQSEIPTLKGFLVQWSAQPDADTRGPADTAMTGMVGQATMTKLGSLHGADYDRLWLQSMISHHQGAVDMANTEIANGLNADAIALAKRMVSTQQGEIDQMKKMLGG
jgi:uncharacterized protein (DUF305 family)